MTIFLAFELALCETLFLKYIAISLRYRS